MVIALDDDASTLELDRSLTWQAGVGVALDYAGSAPDTGAFETR